MNLEDLFRTVDCEMAKAFDIRRERREFRRYAKEVRLFGGAKGYMRHLRTNRKYYQWMAEGYEEPESLRDEYMHDFTGTSIN